MIEQAELRIDRYRSAHWKEELPARARFSLVVSFFLAVIILAAPAALPAQVSVSVTIGPPALPVYEQPLCPGPGFIWTPGYWAWDPDYGYYWVPGAWVPAPFVGALWTPGYWGWGDGVFIWHEGYWGPVVGFYGGINYGFGYTGSGYYGGYWRGNTYYYNRTVNNVNVTNITNVYSKRVINVQPRGASFNGGHGGTTARPTFEQLAAARERRASVTNEQKHHMQIARTDPGQRVSVNHGRPGIAATPKPGAFTGHGVVRASRAGAPYKEPSHDKAPPRERVRSSRPDTAVQPREARPERERMAPGTPRPETGERFNESVQPRRRSAGSERIAPRTPRRELERMAPGIQRQEREQGVNEPRSQRQRPKPAPRKENNMSERGERREFR